MMMSHWGDSSRRGMVEPGAAVTGPITDEAMAVGRTAQRDGRDCGLSGCGRATAATPTSRRAWLGTVGERLRVGKAVDAAETFGSAGVPGQQGNVLQVVGGPAGLGDEGLRCRDIVLQVGIRRFEQEVVGGGARAAARGLFSRTHPGGENVSGDLDVAAVDQRIVQRVLDELGELLRERLHVGVRDHSGRVMEVGGEHEGISGGGIDAVRSPGAAHGSVAERVISGVMRHGDDQLALLFGELFEEFLLQKLDDRRRRRPRRSSSR